MQMPTWLRRQKVRLGRPVRQKSMQKWQMFVGRQEQGGVRLQQRLDRLQMRQEKLLNH